MNQSRSHLHCLLTCLLAITMAQSVAADMEAEAVAFQRQEAGIRACDADHFLYGVAYIDGSYMERLFFVRKGVGSPELNVELRDTGPWLVDGEVADGDLPAIPFTMELAVSQARYAEFTASGWRATDRSWHSSFRFK